MNAAPPIKGMSKAIFGGNDAFNVGMFLACASTALEIPDAIEQFRKDTGCTWSPATSGIDRMIDEATGAADAFCAKWLDWVAANVWGEPSAELPIETNRRRRVEQSEPLI